MEEEAQERRPWPWPAEKSSGGRDMRRRDQAPGVKPFGYQGIRAPSSEPIVFGREGSESGRAKHRRGRSCREAMTISVERSVEGRNPRSEPG